MPERSNAKKFEMPEIENDDVSKTTKFKKINDTIKMPKIVDETQKMGKIQTTIKMPHIVESTIKMEQILPPEEETQLAVKKDVQKPRIDDAGYVDTQDNETSLLNKKRNVAAEIPKPNFEAYYAIAWKLDSMKEGDMVIIPYNNGFTYMKGKGGYVEILKRKSGDSYTGTVKSQLEMVEELLQTKNWSIEPRVKEGADENGDDIDFKALPEGGIVNIGGQEYEKIEYGNFMVKQRMEQEGRTLNFEVYNSKEMKEKLEAARRYQHKAMIVDQQPKKESVVKDDRETTVVRNAFLNEASDYYPLRGSFFSRVAKQLGWESKKEKEMRYGRDALIERIRNNQMEQGRVGNCYLVAAINCFKKQMPELYLDTISRNISHDKEKKTYKVRFPGIQLSHELAPGGWITVSEKDVEAWKGRGMKGDLPDIILERAYASAVSRQKNQEKGKTMIQVKGDLPVEGGFGHRALSHLLSSDIAKKIDVGNYAFDGSYVFDDDKNLKRKAEIFFSLYEKNPNRYLVMATSPHSDRNKKQQNDTKQYEVAGHKFYYRHQYSVLGMQNGKVVVENPHDTKKQILLTKEEFMKAFAQIVSAEIVGKYSEAEKGK